MEGDPTIAVPGLTPNPTYKADVIRSTVDNCDLINDVMAQNAALKTLDHKTTLNSQASSNVSGGSGLTLDPSSLNRPRLPPPEPAYDMAVGDDTGNYSEVQVTNIDTGKTQTFRKSYENVDAIIVPDTANADSGYSTATVVDADAGHYDVIGDLGVTSSTPKQDIPVYAQPNKIQNGASKRKDNDVSNDPEEDVDPDDVTLVDNTVYGWH